jgi:hypothetical protein
MRNESAIPIKAYARVRMMLVQMGMVVLTMFVMLLIPMPYSLALLSLLYWAVVALERRMGVISPISHALLLACLVLFLAHVSFETESWEPYVPGILFSVLALVGGVCLLRRCPATLCYGGQHGALALHWRTSSLWFGIYCLGMFFSGLIVHHPQFFWILPLLPLTGVCCTLWLQLVDMGRAWRRPTQFSLGSFTFTQLQPVQGELQPFYEHFIREALPSIRQGIRPGDDTFESLVKLKIECDQPTWGETLFFTAVAEGEVIGTISCMLKTDTNSLGFETGHTHLLKLDSLRSFGKVIEVGRFSISPKHRFGQDVIQGLLRCAVEYAFETDAAFLVSQSYLTACPIYQKIGFIKVNEQISHQKVLGVAIYPMVFNLARRVICESHAEVTNRLSNVLSPYRGERYFKRLSITSLFRRTPVWALDDDEVISMISVNSSSNAVSSVGVTSYAG